MNISELPKERRNCIIYNTWLKERHGRATAMYTAMNIAPETARKRFSNMYVREISSDDFDLLAKHMMVIEKQEIEFDQKCAIRNQKRRCAVLNWMENGAGRQQALAKCMGKLPCQIYQDYAVRAYKTDLSDQEWQDLQYFMRNIESHEAYNLLMYLCVMAWASLSEGRLQLLKKCYIGKGYVFMTRISPNQVNQNLIAYPEWDKVIDQMRYIEHIEQNKKVG